MSPVQPRRSPHPRHRAFSRLGRTRQVATRLVLAAGVAATAACAPRSQGPQASSARSTKPVAPVHTEAEIRDLDLAFYQARADRDPTGAADLAHVAALYLQRSRDTGDPRDAIRAEAAARRSIHNRAGHNGQASQILASSLLSQHRFVEALDVSRVLSNDDPTAAPLRAAVGEIQMELGQYDSARATFAAISGATADLSVTPRLARWAEIEGHPDEARRLMQGALTAALSERSLPKEQVAWFWLRVGDLELRTGHPAAADSDYQSGLAAHPGDYRLLSALARTAAAEQRWSDAVTFGDEAVAANLDPATLGTLSDSYAALGDSAQSAEYARVLDVAVLRQPGAYHRAWSLFLLDHDRHVDAVYAKIREELRSRKDIYGYDLLAWALHKEGRDADAERAMHTALAQGTEDAQLFYHAGMIEHSLGHGPAARELLAKALAVNPYFQPTQVATARAVLASLPVTTASVAEGQR